MPSGLAALSYTMNGLSYASSGKGVADHALSAATEQDCAVLRAVQGVDICGSSSASENATLMTMIDGLPAVSGRKHIPSSVPAIEASAEPSPKNERNQSTVAFESIYGTAR